MMDHRTNRSADTEEALGLLLDSVSRAHGGRAIALVDDHGRVLAGSGSPHEMWTAVRMAKGEAVENDDFEEAEVPSSRDGLRLVSLGVAKGRAGMDRAAESVARILSQG